MSRMYTRQRIKLQSIEMGLRLPMPLAQFQRDGGGCQPTSAAQRTAPNSKFAADSWVPMPTRSRSITNWPTHRPASSPRRSCIEFARPGTPRPITSTWSTCQCTARRAASTSMRHSRHRHSQPSSSSTSRSGPRAPSSATTWATRRWSTT